MSILFTMANPTTSAVSAPAVSAPAVSVPAVSVPALNETSFEDLDEDQKEAAAYMKQALDKGQYDGIMGARLLWALRSLAPLWHKLARCEALLGPSLQTKMQAALPDTPPDCLSGTQMIYDNILIPSHRLQPRRFTHLVSTVTALPDHRIAILENLEDTVDTLSAFEQLQ